VTVIAMINDAFPCHWLS